MISMFRECCCHFAQKAFPCNNNINDKLSSKYGIVYILHSEAAELRCSYDDLLSITNKHNVNMQISSISISNLLFAILSRESCFYYDNKASSFSRSQWCCVPYEKMTFVLPEKKPDWFFDYSLENHFVGFIDDRRAIWPKTWREKLGQSK